MARALHPSAAVKLFSTATLVRDAVVRLARRGTAAAPPDGRRRVLLLQIDGLSSRRLRQALARGDMPHLTRRLDGGRMRLKRLSALTPPSTPVFQAGLMYGARGDVPGFGWYDRALGRAVRMDLPEDVAELERHIRAQAPERRPLLEEGVSYGTIWPGGAAHAFFNVVLWLHGEGASARRVAQNLWDRVLSTGAGGMIAARVAARMALELGVAAHDFVRWCRRIRSTRFEWRFLYMRLFVSVVLRDLATQGAIVDILRGVPRIYVDFLGYDEYAHRRGPDAEMALYNLSGIDHSIEKIIRATEAMPEYGYDVYVFSDHGQSATMPFERVVGRDLHAFVLEHAALTGVGRPIGNAEIRDLVTLRETELWVRTLWRPLRAPMALYLAWLDHRLSARVDDQARAPLDGIEVVTGGSIAHLYFGRRGRSVDAIARRWPRLLEALVASPAIGLVCGRGAAGPVVFFRGVRYDLQDRPAVERLEPFRRLGYDVLAEHLRQAVESGRSGDLVLYGAFAEVGDVAFDFEFGSHGGVGPDELDQFVIYPAHVDFPLSGAARAEDFYAFFHARYVCHEDPRVEAA